LGYDEITWEPEKNIISKTIILNYFSRISQQYNQKYGEKKENDKKKKSKSLETFKNCISWKQISFSTCYNPIFVPVISSYK